MPALPMGPTGTHFAGNSSAQHRAISRRLPQFGPYVVEGELGRGAMGEVFRVRHAELATSYALKLLSAELQTDDEALARFDLERQVLAALDHPGIVRVHFAGRTPSGRPFCVMDLVNGPTLGQAVTEGAGSEQVLDYIEQVARALGHAHARGIVHRDVKPDNILIERSTNCARLTDFGLVKLLGPLAMDLTKSNISVGTPRYMAPEQVVDRQATGPWTDVFALGAMVFELFCLKTPYEAPTTIEVFQLLAHAKEPVVFRCGRVEIDHRFGPLLERALHPDPRQRPQDGVAFAEELAAARRDDAQPTAPSPLRKLAPTALVVVGLAAAFFAGRSSQPPASTASNPPTPAEATPQDTQTPPPKPPPALAEEVTGWRWKVGTTRRFELRLETEFTRAVPAAREHAILLATGIDPDSYSPLPLAGHDPRWLLVETPAGKVDPKPVLIPKDTPWQKGHRKMRQWVCPPGGLQGAPGRYRYRIEFESPTGFQREGVVLQASLHADNFLREIVLNGKVIARPENTKPLHFSHDTIPVEILAGKNRVEVVVENGTEEANPTGFAAAMQLLAFPNEASALNDRWEGTRSYELSCKAQEVTAREVVLVVELQALRLRRSGVHHGEEREARLFDSGRESQEEDPLLAAVGKSFVIVLDPRTGEVDRIQGMRDIQAAIDALSTPHPPGSTCYLHALAELTDTEHLRGVLSSLWALHAPRPAPGEPLAQTWRRKGTRPWFPYGLPVPDYTPTFVSVEGGATWQGSAPLSGRLERPHHPPETLTGNMEVTGKASFEGGQLVLSQQTLRLKGVLTSTIPGREGETYSCQGRIQSHLKRLR